MLRLTQDKHPLWIQVHGGFDFAEHRLQNSAIFGIIDARTITHRSWFYRRDRGGRRDAHGLHLCP